MTCLLAIGLFDIETNFFPLIFVLDHFLLRYIILMMSMIQYACWEKGVNKRHEMNLFCVICSSWILFV